jgi:hypothetical protein
MKGRSRATLAVEPLEPRDLMAADVYIAPLRHDLIGQGGHVTAEVIDGTLVIRGDAQANRINVFAGPGDVVHLDGAGGWSFINGRTTGVVFSSCEYLTVALSGVTRGIDIDLGDGDDKVAFHGYAPGIKISTGAGNDSVRLGGWGTSFTPCVVTASIKYPHAMMIDGDLTIDTGDGDDLVTPFANVSGDATIQMGAGDDTYLEAASTVLQSVIRHELKAEGALVVDLGPDEAERPLPSDWRDDSRLADKVQGNVVSAFERYAEALSTGEVAAGQEFTWQPANDSPPARFRADGRLEIEFTFFAGDEETINRLKSRGVTIEGHAGTRGFAYAAITQAELALFAQLPTLGEICLRGVFWRGQLPFHFDGVQLVKTRDVNGDGVVNPADAIEIASAMARANKAPLSARPDISSKFDLNDDGYLSPLDALLVVSDLKPRSAPLPSPFTTPIPGGTSLPRLDLEALAIDQVIGELAIERRLRIG